MAYIVPQVLVFQEFNIAPAALTGTLNAHISGPHAFLLRYAEPNEKLLAFLGAYDPLNTIVSEWPQRPPGGIIDFNYTKIYIDNADLEYYVDLTAAGTGTSKVTPVVNSSNQIRCDDTNLPTCGFALNGAYPRYPLLFDRDVQPGDLVHIRGASGGTNYELDTYVMAVEADPTGASVGSASSDGANGKTNPTGSAIVTPPTGYTGPTLTASITNYDALADGVLDDTYTITIADSSSGGTLATATVNATTASGHDSAMGVPCAASGTAFTVGNRGLSLTFTGTGDLISGQVFTIAVQSAYSAISATSSAVVGGFRGAQSTTYIIEFTQGGHLAGPDYPMFSAITTLGTDSSPPQIVNNLANTYPVGTDGLLIQFSGSPAPTGIRKGDKFYVIVTGVQEGRMAVLVLGHNLPSELVGQATPPNLDLTLSVQRNIMVDQISDGITNWTQNGTQIIVNGGIIAYDEEFTAGGQPRPLTVTSGDIYVEYRAWISDLANSVNGIYDVGTIDEAISGPLTPDNPLKWGVYNALSNSNGSFVMFTAVANPDDLNSWVAVLDLLVGRVDVYNLVPLTFDRQVQDLYAAHVNDESSPEQARWRALWGSIQAKSQAAVVDQANSSNGQVVMATIDVNNAAVGIEYTLLTVPTPSNSNFIANRVQPGDVVRTDYGIDSSGNEIYDEYIIDQVLTEDSLLLMSGPPAKIGTPQKIEVWRYLSKDEIAADLAEQAGSFGSRRVKMVWPDTVGSGGVLMEGYYLACALAGLRSGILPHQGMTNLQIAGFDDLTRTTNFFGGNQLNVMAGAGTWIVTQSPDGTVYTRHALTTDNTDVNSSEEMVTTNLDSISYLFALRLAPFIGLMNVTPSGLMILGVEIDSCINFLKSNGTIARLGPQLIAATVVSLQPHAILPDRVVCVIDVTLPYPLNNLEVHLVV
jgi:hypothetical protein